MATVKKTAPVRQAAAPQTQRPSAPKPRTTAKKSLGTKVSTPTPPSGKTKPAQTAESVKLVKAVKTPKADKVKKPKLVRDSFTIPKAEYLVLDALKVRAVHLNRQVKKSELLRAGIKTLAALSNAAFLTALEQVPTIKTGRPATNQSLTAR